MTGVPEPTDIVGLSFLLVTFAMLAMAAFLLLQGRRVPLAWQMPVMVMGSVALISGLNYLMLSSLWAEHGAAATAYRFIDWQLTVPLQTITFYLILRAMGPAPAALFWRLLVASAVLTASAYLGAVDLINPTLGFLVSLVGGLYIIGELYLGEASRLNAASADRGAQSAFNAVRLIATIGWAIYPLGYFMEHLGGGVDGPTINLIYNLADFLNTITFGLVIFQEAATDRVERRGT